MFWIWTGSGTLALKAYPAKTSRGHQSTGLYDKNLFMPDLVKGKNLSATAGTGVWT
jgi:hypothetical protein